MEQMNQTSIQDIQNSNHSQKASKQKILIKLYKVQYANRNFKKVSKTKKDHRQGTCLGWRGTIARE